MTLYPTNRLLRMLAAWTLSTLLVVVLPALWPVATAAFGLIIALIVWDALLQRPVRSVGVGRQLPARAYVGREAHVELRLQNDNPVPVLVDVVDEVATDVGDDPHFPSVAVPARDATLLRYTVRPRRRGDRAFGTLVILQRSPLGLLQRRVLSTAPQTLQVYPDTARYLRPEALDPKRIFAAIGLRPTPRRGDGMEFESLRDYVPGDDPRRIDWAATARRGRPVTRLYQHERNHTVIVALDASRLMAGRVGERTKLDHAIDAGLALVYAALASADRVGLVVFDSRVHGYLTPRARRHDFGDFVELLRPLEPRLVEADYRTLVRQLSVQQRQRALIVVFTDFVEALSATLVDPLAVLARRHRVLLVAVRDRVYDELQPVPVSENEAPPAFYRRIVLNDLLTERDAALAGLRQSGLQTLDLAPQAMTAAVLNRYLVLRYGPER